MQFGHDLARKLLLRFLFAAILLGSASAVQAAPVVDSVSAVIYRGYVYVIGQASDPSGSLAGGTAVFSGDISGTAEIRADGSFIFAAAYPGIYGEATVVAISPSEEISADYDFEFSE